MGFNVLLLFFAVVIVVGIGSPYGAVLGGLVIGLSQEMSVPLLIWLERPDVLHLEHSTAYKVAIPFIVMIGVLIFRPRGIAGPPPAFARRVFFMERITKSLGRRGDAREEGSGEGGGCTAEGDRCWG